MLMISYVILKYAPYDWLKCNPRLQKKKSRPGRGGGGGLVTLEYNAAVYGLLQAGTLHVSNRLLIKAYLLYTFRTIIEFC